MMKINIRPFLVIASGMLLLFLFIPIYPIGGGEAETKSILNILIGVKYRVMGETETVNRAAALITIPFAIGSFAMSLSKDKEIKNNRPAYIATQVVSMLCWIGDYYVAATHYLFSTTVRYGRLKIDQGFKDAMRWPLIMILINIFLIIAYSLLYWESKIDVQSISFLGGSGIGGNTVSDNSSKVWYCKNCFSSNAHDNIFCGHCGTKRSDEVISSVNPQTTKQHTWICGCGTENLDEDIFCTGCGSSRETVPKPEITSVSDSIIQTADDISEQNTIENVFCRKCGTKSQGGEFCRKCGTKLF